MMLNREISLNGPESNPDASYDPDDPYGTKSPNQTPVNPKIETLYLTGNNVHVRAQPNTKTGKIVAKLKIGTEIKVYEKAADQGIFAHIAAGAHKGAFVARQFLSKTKPKVTPPDKIGPGTNLTVGSAGQEGDGFDWAKYKPILIGLAVFVIIGIIMSKKKPPTA